MARAPLLDLPSNEILAINLSRALSRLEQKILFPPPNSLLQHSSHERSKTSANLEYARTLLLRLEHDSSSIKIQSRKQAVQENLLRQRALIKRLTNALHDLDIEDSDCPSSAEEDLLGEYNRIQGFASSASSPPLSHLKPPTTPSLESNLRNRHHVSPPGPFPNPASSPTSSSTTPLLESDASTQAALTTSLLSLAKALKSSSLAISDSIALDAETLSRATDGLDRNATGMQAAGTRMGLLRRMTEGKGWWGRMMLYAWIGGLWILALVVVFVMPKLRF